MIDEQGNVGDSLIVVGLFIDSLTFQMTQCGIGQLNVCSLGWVIESNTLRSVASACLSFAEPTNQ